MIALISNDGLPAVSFPAPDVKQVMSGAVLFHHHQVKQFTIAGPTAKFDINTAAPGATLVGQQVQLFALDVHAGTSHIAAAGFTGEVVI